MSPQQCRANRCGYNQSEKLKELALDTLPSRPDLAAIAQAHFNAHVALSPREFA